MIRLSEGCQKVVRGVLFNCFSLMTNFLPESCQNKMTTPRLSRYLKFVTGSSSGLSSVERLSIGCIVTNKDCQYDNLLTT